MGMLPLKLPFKKVIITVQHEKLIKLVGGAEDFLSLSEHVQIHWRKEGDVEKHDAKDDEGEGEGDVESVGKVDR